MPTFDKYYEFFVTDKKFNFVNADNEKYFYYRNKHDSDIKITVIEEEGEVLFDLEVYDEIEQKIVVKENGLTFEQVSEKI